tara:strand:- start:244 stop:492 length:249 start_codon:yes stop_codon:yes gene_type:complete
MYYVDYLAMIASYLKPSLNSVQGVSKLRNHKRLSLQKKNQNLLKPLLASLCFLLCIAFVPEKTTNLASICQKYNSSAACQVW